MSYLVFARKFRPQTFDEVVGQHAIITTLKNAIQKDRIPQNFLFSGPRGIGKTSAARILAKCLNCEKAPTLQPCGKCPACEEITQGNSLDVLEIDGASNRGIDEIRNLRETVKFKPVTGKVKIYIIDEVHMLTQEAFNALLKTLEEPPPHVKFVFATTEPHKVPMTILSRCQRFHFKRIPTPDIVEKLKEIAKKEKIKHDKKALFLIAKSSEGSLRDAESLLDQLASFAVENIREEDVLMTLGLAAEETYLEILTAIHEKDAPKVFSKVEAFYEQGGDLVQFAKGLLEILRHLLLFQCAEQADSYVEMSEEGRAALKKKKDDFTRGQLLLALSLVGNLQSQLRRNLAAPRLLVEAVLLKLLHLEGLCTVEQAMEVVGSATPQARHPEAQRAEGSQQKRSFAGAQDDVKSEPTTNSLSSKTLDNIEKDWARVIEYVKSKRMSTGIFLSESEPVEIEGTLVTLGLPSEFQFHKDMLEKSNNLELIKEAFEVVMGQKMGVQIVVTQAEGSSGPAKPKATGTVDSEKMPEIITQAMGIFQGAKVIRKDG